MNQLKDLLIIRKIAKPYMDHKRRKTHERYLRSPDSWYLKTLKGIHAGKRCFIIGNGPSLRVKDLEQLKGEFTFAVNRIYNIFYQTDWRPSFYLAVDPVFLKENADKLKEYELGHMFLNVGEEARLEYPIQKMTRLLMSADSYFEAYQRKYNIWSACVSMDVSNVIFSAGTVVFPAIQLALYMGFSEIYLLGVDFSYSITRDKDGNIHRDENIQDYFDGKRANSELNYETVLHVFKMAKEYCDTHGIMIKNATRGGKLEVFERTTLEEIFGGGV